MLVLDFNFTPKKMKLKLVLNFQGLEIIILENECIYGYLKMNINIQWVDLIEKKLENKWRNTNDT